jgi:hypothetical protein
VQVPLAHVVGPVHLGIVSPTSLKAILVHRMNAHPVPPHCPYNAAPVPLDAVEVAALDDEVMVVVEDFTLVAKVVEVAFAVEDVAVVGDEPPAPQTKGVGPGIVYVVKVW